MGNPHRPAVTTARDNSSTLNAGENALERRCGHSGKEGGSFFQNEACNYHTKSNCTPGHLARRNEDLRSPKNLSTDVRGSGLCNSPKPETTQLPFRVDG